MPHQTILIHVVIAILVLSAFGLIRFFFHRYMLELLDKFRQNNIGLRQVKEELNARTQSSVIFNVFGYGIIALALLVVAQETTIYTKRSAIQLYFILLALLPLLILCKRIFVLFVAKVFHATHLVRIYLYQTSLLRKIVGIVLAPVIALYFALHHFMAARIFLFYLLLIAFAFLFIFTLFKVINTLLKNSSFRINLHFFLYLCAIEILPVLLICKKVLDGSQ